jgi:hypothetical protein
MKQSKVTYGQMDKISLILAARNRIMLSFTNRDSITAFQASTD